MIVHELATNDLKYAALSVPEGRVAISWVATDEDGRMSIALDWVETGGSTVEPPQAKGFESRPIRSGLGGPKGSVSFFYGRS